MIMFLLFTRKLPVHWDAIQSIPFEPSSTNIPEYLMSIRNYWKVTCFCCCHILLLSLLLSSFRPTPPFPLSPNAGPRGVPPRPRGHDREAGFSPPSSSLVAVVFFFFACCCCSASPTFSLISCCCCCSSFPVSSLLLDSVKGLNQWASEAEGMSGTRSGEWSREQSSRL